MHDVLLVIHLLIAIGLVASILVQRSDAEGFGSGGGGNAFMSGRAQANFLTRTTAILATGFMLTSLALTLVGRASSTSIVDTIQSTAPATPASNAAAPAPNAAAPAPADGKPAEAQPAAPAAPATGVPVAQ